MRSALLDQVSGELRDPPILTFPEGARTEALIIRQLILSVIVIIIDERRQRCCVFREVSDIWDYCPPRRGGE